MHPNPDIQKHKHILKSVDVINPINHSELINILKKCKFVISDSGGLQEESSFLNKKIIICRKTSERNEIIGTHGIFAKILLNLTIFLILLILIILSIKNAPSEMVNLIKKLLILSINFNLISY